MLIDKRPLFTIRNKRIHYWISWEQRILSHQYEELFGLSMARVLIILLHSLLLSYWSCFLFRSFFCDSISKSRESFCSLYNLLSWYKLSRSSFETRCSSSISCRLLRNCLGLVNVHGRHVLSHLWDSHDWSLIHAELIETTSHHLLIVSCTLHLSKLIILIARHGLVLLLIPILVEVRVHTANRRELLLVASHIVDMLEVLLLLAAITSKRREVSSSEVGWVLITSTSEHFRVVS